MKAGQMEMMLVDMMADRMELKLVETMVVYLAGWTAHTLVVTKAVMME